MYRRNLKETDLPAMRELPGVLDRPTFAAFDFVGFQDRLPYPWAEIERAIEPKAFALLREAMPCVAMFKQCMGKRRRHGQQSHDRFVLDYDESLNVHPIWHEFVSELHGPEYRNFAASCLGTDNFRLNTHWHFTPRGCSVSPHCDAEWKLGSHIFYFNDVDDWDIDWGGGTQILNDESGIPWNSAPAFDDFLDVTTVPCVGNRSLVFTRTNHSWHGVQPLACPNQTYRKVFIVEFLRDRAFNRLRSLFGT